MKRRLNSRQRNYIIAGLCMILVIMGVGYAAFQSQLKISGTSNIASNFLVKITGIEVSSKSEGAADKPEVTTYNDTTATFGTTLQSPGDSITYDITIENQGSIDAVLKTISKTDTNNSAIIFETSGVNEGDPLNVGEIATMQVKVTYNPSVESQPTDLNSTLKVDLTYEQSEGIVTPPTPSGKTPNDLKALAVTSGDGLYADEYEAGRYVYKGTNPNNYITFNNETWRIISLERDNTIKIMQNESIGRRIFDESIGRFPSGAIASSYDWETSDIKIYLNEEYLSTITTNADKIVSHTWSIGTVTPNNNDLAEQVAEENETQSQSASVGLITVSEYLRANTNAEQCGNYSLNNTNRTICLTTNWIKSIIPTNYALWTISPNYNDKNLVFAVSDYNQISDPFAIYGSDVADIFPVLYLSSDITLTGDGSSSNPFIITN